MLSKNTIAEIVRHWKKTGDLKGVQKPPYWQCNEYPCKLNPYGHSLYQEMLK